MVYPNVKHFFLKCPTLILTCTSRRSFHCTSFQSLRKKPDLAIKRTPEEEEKRAQLKAALKKYTPSEEQANLIRETILVRTYLEKLKEEVPKLKDSIPYEPYVAPTSEQYLRFQYVDSWKNPTISDAVEVVLTMYVPHLVSTEKLNEQQLHLLLLLCGSQYDRLSQTIRISCLRYPYRAQNRRWLVDLVNRLLDYVKNAKDTFSDIPLSDSKYVQKKVKELEKRERCKFPLAWITTTEQSNLNESKSVNSSVTQTSSLNSSSETSG